MTSTSTTESETYVINPARKEKAMAEPRICYFFIKLAVGRTLFLLIFIFVVLCFFGSKRISSSTIFERILNSGGLIVLSFVISVGLLCLLNFVTSKINPAGYGCCYTVMASHSYIPSVEVLCDDSGYQVDMNGIPLFNSYDDYREWYINTFPEKAYQD